MEAAECLNFGRCREDNPSEDARGEHGNRRLDNPNDFVRIEIAAALQRNIPVIPILLDGATIPKATQLPEDLQELALCNAMEIRHASFHDDMNRLRGPKGQSDQAGAVEGVHLAGEGASDFPTKTHVPKASSRAQMGCGGSYVTSIISRFSVGSEAGSSLRRRDFGRRLSISSPL